MTHGLSKRTTLSAPPARSHILAVPQTGAQTIHQLPLLLALIQYRQIVTLPLPPHAARTAPIHGLVQHKLGFLLHSFLWAHAVTQVLWPEVRAQGGGQCLWRFLTELLLFGCEQLLLHVADLVVALEQLPGRRGALGRVAGRVHCPEVGLLPGGVLLVHLFEFLCVLELGGFQEVGHLHVGRPVLYALLFVSGLGVQGRHIVDRVVVLLCDTHLCWIVAGVRFPDVNWTVPLAPREPLIGVRRALNSLLASSVDQPHGRGCFNCVCLRILFVLQRLSLDFKIALQILIEGDTGIVKDVGRLLSLRVLLILYVQMVEHFDFVELRLIASLRVVVAITLRERLGAPGHQVIVVEFGT